MTPKKTSEEKKSWYPIDPSEEIPFNAWSRRHIASGKKICTSRKKRYMKDNRVTWISPKLPWWFIRTYLWRPEGAESPEELQKVIDLIFKRIVEDSEEFYVHFGNFTKALGDEK